MDLRRLVFAISLAFACLRCGGHEEAAGPGGATCPGCVCEAGVPGCEVAPPRPAIPDISGTWTTQHEFSLAAALPRELQLALRGLRLVDQTVSGSLGLPRWLDEALRRFVHLYVPAPVRTLVRLGDDLGTLLSSMRARGTMRLTRALDDPRRVAGTEVWTSISFDWLPLCGEAVGGDPSSSPPCARLDLPTTSVAPAPAPLCGGRRIPAAAVEVRPFHARLAGQGPAQDEPPWTLQVDPRSVDARLASLLGSALDVALSRTTPWTCIEEATDCGAGKACLVDCAGLARRLSLLSAGTLSSRRLEPLCAGAVGLLGREAVALLSSLPFEADGLHFAGSAQLQGMLDGRWTGAFFARPPRAMPGLWQASRQRD